MIRINLLPPELRAPERTPLGRMLAILVGAVLVALSVIMVVAVQGIWLPGARGLQQERKDYRDKVVKESRQIDALQGEIAGYEHWRKTIADIKAGRILWAKKLDQLADLIPDDIWVDRMQLQAARAVGKGKVKEGPTLTLDCHVVGGDESRIADFLRILKQDDPKKNDFFDDFLYVEEPGWKAEEFKDFKEQLAYAFRLVLHMKPLGVEASQ